MSIGGKIKRLRLKLNLTQEELANRTELSKGFISQLERDLTSPSIATLMDILEALGTNLSEFFYENPKRSSRLPLTICLLKMTTNADTASAGWCLTLRRTRLNRFLSRSGPAARAIWMIRMKARNLDMCFRAA